MTESQASAARKQDALTAAKAEVQKAAGKANIKIEAYSCDVSKAAPIADTVKKIEEYRQALAGGNPAELWEARGEDLWKKKAGPKNMSLETCDLGLGPGKVQGAYAALPRYFADTRKVQDLESRLLTCMETLQGFDAKAIIATPFGKVYASNLTSDVATGLGG